MKILFVHGIGFHESTDQINTWIPDWMNAITSSARQHSGLTFDIANPFGSDNQPSGLHGDRALDPGVLYYENLIRSHAAPDALDYLGVVSSLLASAVTTTVGDLFRRDRSIFDIPEELKWKAREVAAWACNESMRASLRARVIEEIETKDPDIVIAHSYGGLITYDAFLFGKPDLLEKRHLITLGTQIGNPLLRKEFGGYQIPVRCRHWFNLYNPKDKVFVSSLAHIKAENFTQILTPHEVGGGHDGATYLSHPDFAALAWPHIVNDGKKQGATATRSLSLDNKKEILATKPRKTEEDKRQGNRALLIGVDRYASALIPPLQGCVNDTFQLSATLQEAGIDHRQIRLVHNSHATRQNLLSHIQWLLDDARPGDHRFLSFSGHGHRRPSYSPDGQPLALHEVLCTHDYDPSTDSGLRDSDFQDIYANLPHDVHFTIFLDCCHSGGITRSGGPAIRSFQGPADIEHESSKWNAQLEMWEQGPLLAKSLNPQFLPGEYHSKELASLWQKLREIQDSRTLTPEQLHDHEARLYYGQYGDTRRIGRATPLRDLTFSQYDDTSTRLRKLHPEHFQDKEGKNLPIGPYLPLVFMACGEAEQASEYVHGAVSYGAFTYAFTLTLRDVKHHRIQALNYGELLVETARKLRTLGYTQIPDILGPPDQLSAPTPFSSAGRTTRSKPVKSAKARSSKKTTSKKRN
jgi:metacaspase-1